jgi:hypothetical protein
VAVVEAARDLGPVADSRELPVAIKKKNISYYTFFFI